MTSRFQTCLDRVLIHEGGCCDVKGDKGGRTAYGITQRVYDEYRLSNKLPPDTDVWLITKEEVEAIYHANYWTPCWCHKLPNGLDYLVFDSAVNHGMRRAVKWLQCCLGTEEDGVLGMITLRLVADMANSKRTEAVVERYAEIRRVFYRKLAEDETQAKFLKGWLNRIGQARAIAVGECEK